MNERPASDSIGLAALPDVQLTDEFQEALDVASAHVGGPKAFRHRKINEARDLLRLAQCSGRLTLLALDLQEDLRAMIDLDVPVPCLPDPHGELEVFPRARLGLRYPMEAITQPVPGYSFVRILAPGPVIHANVSPDRNQALCLGNLAAGLPLREIVLMTYGALSLASVQLDVMDPAGVLSPAGAEFWQRNLARIPLTREPFFRKPNPST